MNDGRDNASDGIDLSDPAALELLARVAGGRAPAESLRTLRERFGDEEVDECLADMQAMHAAKPEPLDNGTFERLMKQAAAQSARARAERPITKRRSSRRIKRTSPWGWIALAAGAAACLGLILNASGILKQKTNSVVNNPAPVESKSPSVESKQLEPVPVAVGPNEGWSIDQTAAGLVVDGKSLLAGTRVGPKSVLRNLSTTPARILAEGKIRITLDAGAELSAFTAEKTVYKAALQSGRAFVEYFHSPLDENRKILQFRNGEMDVTVTATRFELERKGDGQSFVRVAGGTVRVKNIQTKPSVSVGAGQEAVVSGVNVAERRDFDLAQTLKWLPEAKGGAWNLLEDGGFDSGKAAWFDNDMGRADEWDVRMQEGPGGNALYREKKAGDKPRLQQAVEQLEVGAKYRLSYRFRIDAQTGMGWGGLSVECETYDWKTQHAKVYHRLKIEQPMPNLDVVKAGVWQERSIEFTAQSEHVRVLVGMDGDLLLNAAVDDIRLVKIK